MGPEKTKPNLSVILSCRPAFDPGIFWPNPMRFFWPERKNIGIFRENFPNPKLADLTQPQPRNKDPDPSLIPPFPPSFIRSYYTNMVESLTLWCKNNFGSDYFPHKWVNLILCSVRELRDLGVQIKSYRQSISYNGNLFSKYFLIY